MRFRWLPAAVALVVVATACGGGSSAAKHKKPPVTKTPGSPVARLTGLPDAAGQSLTRPALSIKIENTPEARPQTGIANADVVYEEITEPPGPDGITRFIAVYNSSIPSVAGPVRSVRIMDTDILAPLGGIFVYSGGIPETVNALGQVRGLKSIVDTGADPALFRDTSKNAPHNLYARAGQLLARGGKPVPPPQLFQYLAANEPAAGDPVQSFSVKFDPLYAPTYNWDAGTSRWKRYIGLVPFVDSHNNTQVAPSNVIVQFDGCCLNSPEGAKDVTTGNGEAWFFTAGKVVKGKWSRSDRTQVIQYTDANGQPIKFTPGRTWVEFVPNEYNPARVPIVAALGTPTPSNTAPSTTTTRRR